MVRNEEVRVTITLTAIAATTRVMTSVAKLKKSSIHN